MNKQQMIVPPKWARKILHFYCPDNLLEEIEGDLEETFFIQLEKKGRSQANLQYTIDVIRFFNPTTFKKARQYQSKFQEYRVNHLAMLKNHLKSAFRNLLKHRYTTAINFAGLVVGMTAALLIWQYVAFEKSYDNFHDRADRIVRVRTDRMNDGVPFLQFAAGTASAGPFMKEHFSEVQDYVKIYGVGESVMRYEEENFLEDKVAFVMPSFFNIFSFQLLQGDPNTSLAEPFTACISERIARKYFGHEDPIGKTIKRNTDQQYKITGVFQDIPENSHLKLDILLSYVTFSDVFNQGGETETSPYWDGYFTYLLLQPGTDLKVMEAKFPAQIVSAYGEGVDKELEFALQPLRDIHLSSHYLIEAEPNGDGNAVKFLLIIGSLVLLIAWFNYINLSTARAETRAREVGIRKVVGSTREHLIGQFLTEASVLNLLAIAVSLGLARMLMPFFEQWVGKKIPFNLFSDPGLWGTIFSVLLLGTLLAGLYPAFVLSSFAPMQVLKGDGPSHSSGNSGNWLRKALVVSQFTASVALIAGTIIVFRQLHFMQDTKLGMNIDQSLVLNTPRVVDSTYQEKYKTFKQEVSRLSTVKSMTGSSTVPGQSYGWTAGGIRRWGAPEEDSEGVQAMAVDFDFTDAFEMEVVAGRAMSAAMMSDSNACMINEKAVQHLHFNSPEEAVNVDINFWGDRLTIVGVLKNFHQQSPRLDFEPLVMRLTNPNRPPGFFTIKLGTQQLNETIKSIESKWEAQFPGNPFNYFFLDEHFNEQYAADQRFGRVFGIFAALAIFVSCLGLFALAAFIAERRTKEIGIRKVLGASMEHLVGLQLKEFIALVGISILIASPLSWWVMNRWLEAFAFRIDIPWWIFLLSGLAAIFIAALTVSFQSLKTALANPVKALKSE